MDLIEHFMEQLHLLVHEKCKEKEEGCHRVAAEIVAGMIRGSKYWTLDMVCSIVILLINSSVSSSWMNYGNN